MFYLKPLRLKTFSFKTALSEANVKTNRMGLQNGPSTKSEVLLVTTLFFLENLFQFYSRTS